jgi:hypothetical protein
MEIIKRIDANVTYHPMENYWWMHNDRGPASWEKSGMVVNKRKFNAFVEKWIGEPFGTTYQTKNKKNPFQKYRVYSVLKGSPQMKDKFLVAVKYGVDTKKDITVDIELMWDAQFNDVAEKFVKEVNKLIVYNSEKTQVYMVIQDDTGLDLRSFDINIPELDIELNYGKEWVEKHDYLMEALTRDTKKGIALLHGLPGTGKSMYIRHLISILAETRTMIYLPNQLINSITDPGFLPLMADYPNSILIIEDAEEAIKSRKQGGATVDKLLNLSDGIISDFLGTQIICTFNNDIAMIDEALLRKGRLILKHEFKRLSKEQAQKLSDKLGYKTTIDRDMTVSEVYNQEEKHSEDVKDREVIGFGFNRNK